MNLILWTWLISRFLFLILIQLLDVFFSILFLFRLTSDQGDLSLFNFWLLQLLIAIRSLNLFTDVWIITFIVVKFMIEVRRSLVMRILYNLIILINLHLDHFCLSIIYFRNRILNLRLNSWDNEVLDFCFLVIAVLSNKLLFLRWGNVLIIGRLRLWKFLLYLL